VSGLKLFHTKSANVVEVAPRLADAEADVRGLVEAHMETMLGVRFLVREYSTGPVHCGRIDSLGLDENGAPVVVEYKRATDAGVIHQGLFYLAWRMDHRDEFQRLVRDRSGSEVAGRILCSSPRVICVAGDFTRYDVHAVRERRRSIDLVRYRMYGDEHIALETVASVSGQDCAPAGARNRTRAVPRTRQPVTPMAGLAAALDEVLLGLGGDITVVQRKQYRTYQRPAELRLCLPAPADQAAYLKEPPADINACDRQCHDSAGSCDETTPVLHSAFRTERPVRLEPEFKARNGAVGVLS
jgi:hypothetical protein